MIVHTWEYPGLVGKGEVIWELLALDENNTQLNLTYNIPVVFEPNEVALRRKNIAMRWNHIVHVGLLNGCAFWDIISWDAFNECGSLTNSVK